MIRIDRLAKNASGWVEEVDLLSRVLKRIVVRSVVFSLCFCKRTKTAASNKLLTPKSEIVKFEPGISKFLYILVRVLTDNNNTRANKFHTRKLCLVPLQELLHVQVGVNNVVVFNRQQKKQVAIQVGQNFMVSPHHM